MQTNKLYQAVLHVIMTVFTLFCILPFWLMVSASLTDNDTILRDGYAFIPKQFDLSAYTYLLDNATNIIHAYGITIFITITGTVAGLAFTALIAYPLSRKDMPFRNALAFYVFFTMLFNGGLVPMYLLYTDIFELKNTLWALLIPNLLVNGFYIIMMRTFFATTIPEAVIESAYMDGAKEGTIFVRIVLPLSMPVLATVGLFYTINYWNDWFNGLIFVSNSELYSLQNLLNRILLDIQFLQSSSQLSSHMSDGVSRIPLESMRMAMAVIGIVPLILLYPFFQKFFVKGLTIGAVKG
ncbi:carbohydrate ABC transporter permease [Paenibacillus lutimineralis]|uniref:Carbohydrate ABC transporter permease n=1 Tax=Paenibacillus lutimineralis TaxID=2707005 RepID=A0A3S9UW88_9BACL|nr:carbohydrate ABC transporter permease [Paenibacillus lutimineralis]AZS14317.1 carbohydrate ABC transporter permease [Paenibacillus lutimineralis]